MTTGKKGLFYSNRITYIPLCDIAVPPYCIQKVRLRSIEDLTKSILRWGVIQPISVRRNTSGYELITGVRRYFAARSAGLNEIPCIILNTDSSESELISLTENTQRKDPDIMTEALTLQRLIQLHRVPVEAVSRYTGMSKSKIEETLALLSLPEDIINSVCDNPEYLPIILPLKDPARMASALSYIHENGLSLTDAKKHIESLIRQEAENSRPEPKMAVSSPVIFTNTVEKAGEMMRKCGYNVDISSEEAGGETRLSIVLSKSR